MKTHGLWVFQRAARKVREAHAEEVWRWWVDAEFDRVRRVMSLPWYGGKVSNAACVVRCTARHARRYGSVRTVSDWNSLCGRIMQRAGWDHHATRSSCMVHYSYRQRSPVRITDENYPPSPRHTASEIRARAERIAAARHARLTAERKATNSLYWRRFLEIQSAREDVRAINVAIRAAKAAMKENAF